MDNLKELRFSCTRCGNCCTDKNTIVNITYLDIKRLISGLNLNLNEILEVVGFYIFDQKTSNSNFEKMVISPIMTEKGLTFVGLIKNAQGVCLFYDNKKEKCLIYNLRPAFCKTFPFSFKEKKFTKSNIDIFYTTKGKQYCPGISNDAPIIDQDYWLNLGETVLRELKENEIFNKKWNDLVEKGLIQPSVRTFLEKILNLIE